jgi:hypothetical protein
MSKKENKINEETEWEQFDYTSDETEKNDEFATGLAGTFPRAVKADQSRLVLFDTATGEEIEEIAQPMKCQILHAHEVVKLHKGALQQFENGVDDIKRFDDAWPDEMKALVANQYEKQTKFGRSGVFKYLPSEAVMRCSKSRIWCWVLFRGEVMPVYLGFTANRSIKAAYNHVAQATGAISQFGATIQLVPDKVEINGVKKSYSRPEVKLTNGKIYRQDDPTWEREVKPMVLRVKNLVADQVRRIDEEADAWYRATGGRVESAGAIAAPVERLAIESATEHVDAVTGEVLPF